MENCKLQKLYKQIDQCRFCKKDKNTLQHIHGFGTLNPRLMLILVNPTHRNISSNPTYKGARFPFIGVRQFWKVLADGSLIDKNVAYSLPLKKDWSGKNTVQIKQELIKNKLFLTNIVKCCYNHSSYPADEIIKSQLEFLKEEIKIVNPEKIIAFGVLVYKTLTGKNIKLFNCGNNSKITTEIISGLNIPVQPCYFPIGCGNPKKAVEIIKKMKITV
jgi:uracil-DNA glycosylase